MNRLVLSYSRYNTYRTCPLQYKKKYVDRETATRDVRHWFVFGNAMHYILEEWYKSKAYTKGWLIGNWIKFLDSTLKSSRVRISEAKYEQHKSDGFDCIEAFIDIVKEHKLISNNPRVESKFNYVFIKKHGSFPEVKFFGRIDLIIPPKEVFSVVDFKTGKEIDVSEQIIIYSKPFIKYYGAFPKNLGYLYLRQGRFIQITPKMFVDMYEGLKKGVTEMVEGAMAEDFPALGIENDKCCFCQYLNTCNAYKKHKGTLVNLKEGEIEF